LGIGFGRDRDYRALVLDPRFLGATVCSLGDSGQAESGDDDRERNADAAEGSDHCSPRPPPRKRKPRQKAPPTPLAAEIRLPNDLWRKALPTAGILYAPLLSDGTKPYDSRFEPKETGLIFRDSCG
jgi:hypothetical protein